MKRLIPIAFLFLFIGVGTSVFSQHSEVSSSEAPSDAVVQTVEVSGLEQGQKVPVLKDLNVDGFTVSRELNASDGTLTVRISGHGLSNEAIQKCISKAVPTDMGITRRESTESHE